MERTKSIVQEIFFAKAEVKHYPRKECNTNAKERGWTQRKILIGWIFVYLYSSSKTIAQHLYPSLAPFATSHFSGLALLSSQAVVESAIFVVTRPAAAKIADHIGRLEECVLSSWPTLWDPFSTLLPPTLDAISLVPCSGKLESSAAI